MTVERHAFKAEMKQLMEIIVHSLYSHQEIFLRELISNAADALDKARFAALTEPERIGEDTEWHIRISRDTVARTLTISDNGIGMSRASIIDDLGTIARSGTRAFLERLREAREKEVPELIGQFGVGFYSAFMVADRVSVVSRAAGETTAVRWESDGDGEYRIEDTERDGRGTDVILHLREAAGDYLQEWRLRELVRKFSDFIEHPILLAVEREQDGKKEQVDETLNSRQAIWLRPRNEITEEQYREFYKHVSRDFENPLRTIHYSGEGVVEFRALLYIPGHRPFDLFVPDRQSGLHLYIRRVFVTNDCRDLLPEHLRFVSGVVDASDLPLNVSRELLQHNPLMEKIRRNLVGRVLSTLEEMKEKAFDDYRAFFTAFGPILKEGIHTDSANRERLAELLLFRSTRTGRDGWTSLKDYVDGMPSDQEAIYYLVGESLDDVERSPVLEGLRARSAEALLLVDPIDEWVVEALREYKGKKLKAADRGDWKADEEAAQATKAAAGEFKGLLETLGKALPEVREVRLSQRLTESAVCLVGEEGAPGAHMQRILQRMGGEAPPPPRRILEVNPRHPVIQGLKNLHDRASTDARIESHARLLFEQALLAEGSRPIDPAAFSRRVSDLMAHELAQALPAEEQADA